MFVIRVRECSTRHHVLREVLGYHASTVRKLLMDAGNTHTKTRHICEDIEFNQKENSQRDSACNRLSFYNSVRGVVKEGQYSGVLTLVERDGGHSTGIEQEDV